MWDLIEAKMSDPHFMAILHGGRRFSCDGRRRGDAVAADQRASNGGSRRSARSASASARASAKGCTRRRTDRHCGRSRRDLVKQLVETLNLSSWLSTETAKKQLAMAGYRGSGAEYAFLAFRLIAPIAFFCSRPSIHLHIASWDRPIHHQDRCRNRRRLRRHQGAGAVPPQHDRQTRKQLERAYPNTLDLC